ncbi:hypothetical protein CI610_02951 [invertebrate metagenome]|uniref:Uncharacterized protein n=1 Tax=invertebrate metagenome TaxID=1711999 RepID=A0A2H9T4F5_9ZZZZ
MLIMYFIELNISIVHEMSDIFNMLFHLQSLSQHDLTKV